MATLVGCGSWADDDYVGTLYPKKLPKNERLHRYARIFDRLEGAFGYHRLPSRKQIEGWGNETPDRFTFDIKLHRDFSDDPAAAAKTEKVKWTLEGVQPLLDAKKFGMFMMTLPPSFSPKGSKLEELDLLAEKLRPHALAVEIRNRGWVDGDARATTLEYFRSRQLVWIAVDVPQLDAKALLPPIDEVTHPRYAYLRLHGRNPDYLKAKTAEDKHRHDYTEDELKEIVVRIRALEQKAQDVHVSLNNHVENFAPKAAILLRRLLGQSLPEDLLKEAKGETQMGLF